MSEPLTYNSKTPRFGFPLLFQGQSQKEFFVNEALSRIDMLLQCAVEGVSDTPPASAKEGDCWLVGENATGDWLGRDGAIASVRDGAWTFAIPAPGFRVFDMNAGQALIFADGWAGAVAPGDPEGGNVIDAEARAAISELIEALRTLSIFPAA